MTQGPTGASNISDRHQAVFPMLEMLHLLNTHARSFPPARCPLADSNSSNLFKRVWILLQDKLGPPLISLLPHTPFSSPPPQIFPSPTLYIRICLYFTLTISLIDPCYLFTYLHFRSHRLVCIIIWVSLFHVSINTIRAAFCFSSHSEFVNSCDILLTFNQTSNAFGSAQSCCFMLYLFCTYLSIHRIYTNIHTYRHFH